LAWGGQDFQKRLDAVRLNAAGDLVGGGFAHVLQGWADGGDLVRQKSLHVQKTQLSARRSVVLWTRIIGAAEGCARRIAGACQGTRAGFCAPEWLSFRHMQRLWSAPAASPVFQGPYPRLQRGDLGCTRLDLCRQFMRCRFDRLVFFPPDEPPEQPPEQP